MKDLDFIELNTRIRDCTRCALSNTRIRPVFGEGNIQSQILILAQAPGEFENRAGKMFLGPSGKLFYELLSGAGIPADSFYMTNLIKCFLPKSRRPSKNEIEACSHYLEQEISLLRPRLIIPLGFHATRYILKRCNLERPESKKYNILYGKLIQTEEFFIFPLRHPTALLFNPDKRDLMKKNYTKARVLMTEIKGENF